MKNLRIDIHVHFEAMDPDRGVIVSKRMRRDPLYRMLMIKYGHPFNDDRAITRLFIKNLLRDIRESEEIDRAVLLALDGVYGPDGRLDRNLTHILVPNDYCKEVCDAHEELVFGASVNPDRADAMDELERAAGMGAVLVKWLPPSQDIDPADEKYAPFYKKLADLGLPLLTHTGYEHCIPVTNQMYGDPKRLKLALEQGVTVIAAHSGASGIGHPVEFFDDFLQMLSKYNNLYGDLSAITGLSRAPYTARILNETGFMDRFIQGSDYPIPPMPFLFLPQIGLEQVLKLSAMRNIFDRDMKLKRALGFPESVFNSASQILRLPDNAS